MMRRLLILAIVLLLSVAALAATNTLKFNCQYPNYVDKEGTHRVKGDFRLTFILDLDTGTAYMLSKTGSTQVHASPSEQGVTFTEFTPSGHVRTRTVVYYSGPSAHQRYTLIAGKWVTTQYYGTCQRVVTGKAPD